MEFLSVRYLTIRKFTLDTLLINIAMFCVFSYALFENADVTFSVVSSIKMPVLILGAISLILLLRGYIGKLFTKKYFKTFFLLSILILFLLGNAFINRNPIIGISPIKKTLRLLLYLIDLFVLSVVLAEKGLGKNAIQFLYRYILILVILNDFLMFSGVRTFASGRHEIYLIGNKFAVSYLHMSLFVFWILSSEKMVTSYRYSLYKVILAASFYLAVSLRVNCMTGVIGCLMLVAVFILIESPNKGKVLRFTSPWMLLMFMAGSVVFAFIAEMILSIPIVSYLVNGVLGRDISLTGRTEIYALYTMTIPKHWLTGYGFGNAYDVTSTLFDFDNVQNALLQWIIQVGVLTTAMLVCFLVNIFSDATRKKAQRLPSVLALVALVYTYVILGSVETTFNMSFILWFGMIFMLANEKTPGRISRSN